MSNKTITSVKVVKTKKRVPKNSQEVITTVGNTGIVTILEHNKILKRVTALVHLGDKVVKIDKRRDHDKDIDQGLQELVLGMVHEDIAAERAEIIWELGE